MDDRCYRYIMSLTNWCCRIAMLLKGRGAGGIAPPFLSFGVDSDEESKPMIDKSIKPAQIPMSIDSDDGKLYLILLILKCF